MPIGTAIVAGDQHRKEGQKEGRLGPFGKGREDRTVEEDRFAEIAARKLAEEEQILHERAADRGLAASASRRGPAGVASGPSMTAAGSPGATRTMRNTIVTTTNITASHAEEALQDVAGHGQRLSTRAGAPAVAAPLSEAWVT